MNIIDLIIKKRDKKELSEQEINFFINSVVDKSIEDYQTSAMLMAMCINGLNQRETSDLTHAIANSGKRYDLSDINDLVVDKHSTGGVADTTTLITAPLVASLGVPVLKMSGRGLGFSGGTADKLSAIPGFNTNLTIEEAKKQVKDINIALMTQTEETAYADKILYSLRDVTGTVESKPLIASSIMSKKIASGTTGVVLDVKCGKGAFMKTYEDAKELAKLMVNIGRFADVRTVAVISSMEQPLGHNIGNALEVIEAIEILKGNLKGDLFELSMTLGAHMLVLSKVAKNVDIGYDYLMKQLVAGHGLNKLRELIAYQGGNPDIIDDYSLLPKASNNLEIFAKESGYLNSVDTDMIGKASVLTGAGRLKKTDEIDLGAGITLSKRIGDYIENGEKIGEIFSSSLEKCEQAKEIIENALHITETAPEKPTLIIDRF